MFLSAVFFVFLAGTVSKSWPARTQWGRKEETVRRMRRIDLHQADVNFSSGQVEKILTKLYLAKLKFSYS